MRHLFFTAALLAMPLVPAIGAEDAAKQKAATSPDQEIKCRKVEVTGSLVKKGRVCKTVAEWRAIAENNNVLARKMVEDGTTRAGGQ